MDLSGGKIAQCTDVADAMVAARMARAQVLKVITVPCTHFGAGGAYLNFMMEEGEDRIRAAYRGDYTRSRR